MLADGTLNCWWMLCLPLANLEGETNKAVQSDTDCAAVKSMVAWQRVGHFKLLVSRQDWTSIPHH